MVSEHRPVSYALAVLAFASSIVGCAAILDLDDPRSKRQVTNDVLTLSDGGAADASSSQLNPKIEICPPINTCLAADTLGDIAGDEQGVPITREGHQSKWFHAHISERLVDASLSTTVRVTLESPPNADYDLYLHAEYRNPCGEPPLNQAIGTERIKNAGVQVLEIPDKQDDFELIIEVRYNSGTCSAFEPWKLTIEGNK